MNDNDEVIKRIPPHSIEAEQSVIGSMLMDRDAIIAASEIVVADDFYQKQYGIMFDTMVELFNEGKPVDLVTLQDRLKEKDVPQSGLCPRYSCDCSDLGKCPVLCDDRS